MSVGCKQGPIRVHRARYECKLDAVYTCVHDFVCIGWNMSVHCTSYEVLVGTLAVDKGGVRALCPDTLNVGLPF